MRTRIIPDRIMKRELRDGLTDLAVVGVADARDEELELLIC